MIDNYNDIQNAVQINYIKYNNKNNTEYSTRFKEYFIIE